MNFQEGEVFEYIPEVTRVEKDNAIEKKTSPEIYTNEVEFEQAQTAFTLKCINEQPTIYSPGIGAFAKRNTFELLGSKDAQYETLLQQLTRIQSEIADIISFITSHPEKEISPLLNGISPSDMVKELHNLETLSHSLSTLVKTSKDKNSENHNNSYEKRLTDIQQNFTADKIPPTSNTPAANPPSLFCAFSSIDQRIHQVEALLGHRAQTGGVTEIEKFSGDSFPYGSLSEAIESIHRRINNLDASKLQTLHTKIQEISGELFENNGGEKGKEKEENRRNSEELFEQTQKINILFEFFYRWKSISNILPLLSERMKSLNQVQKFAVSFIPRLKELEKRQSASRIQLTQTKSLLETVSATMNENFTYLMQVAQRLDQQKR